MFLFIPSNCSLSLSLSISLSLSLSPRQMNGMALPDAWPPLHPQLLFTVIINGSRDMKQVSAHGPLSSCRQNNAPSPGAIAHDICNDCPIHSDQSGIYTQNSAWFIPSECTAEAQGCYFSRLQTYATISHCYKGHLSKQALFFFSFFFKKNLSCGGLFFVLRFSKCECLRPFLVLD